MSSSIVVPLTGIRIDGGTQSRAALNDDAVSDYALAVRDGVDLRPQQEAFDAYVAAQALAKETLSFAHAHEAGRAWARFIDLYLSADRHLGAD